MVDIHSHVIYGVDDGPATIHESIQMLEIAAAHGTTDIVATPHANSEYPYRCDLIEERLAALNERVCPRIRVHLGCDLHLTYENIQNALAETARYSINGKGYLLVEFADTLIPPNTALIFREMLNRGLTPIITHPERNALLQKRVNELASWVEQGVLLQITAQSLLGTFGGAAKKASMQLLRRGLVHFVASDAHDAEHRTPRLDVAFELVAHDFGRDLAHAVFVDNPAQTLTGDALDFAPESMPRAGKRRWFNLFA